MRTSEQFETALEVLEQTNLNWTVKKENLLRPTLEPTDSYGLFHSKSGEHLGTVKQGYQVYQNWELVEDILSITDVDLSNINGDQLQDGRKVFVSIPLETLSIGKNDGIKRYITYLNSHDGSSSVCMGITNKVVSCSNMFYTVAKDMGKVRHSLNMKDKLAILKGNLKDTIEQEKLMMEAMQVLSMKEARLSDVDHMIKKLIPKQNDESKYRKNQRDKLLTCIESEMDSKGKTKWGLFNGVTYYTNHIQNKDQVKNIMLGQGYKMNKTAFETVLN